MDWRVNDQRSLATIPLPFNFQTLVLKYEIIRYNLEQIALELLHVLRGKAAAVLH